MAGAVAERHAVVLMLLAAAGRAAPLLVAATNRYGQTAVHIAARRGSLPLLRALLDAGGDATALVWVYKIDQCLLLRHHGGFWSPGLQDALGGTLIICTQYSSCNSVISIAPATL